MPTPLLIKPTIEEIRLAASKIGLPETEADKFFYHYESNGWKVGRVKMASVNGALAGWRIRWQEKQCANNSDGSKGYNNGRPPVRDYVDTELRKLGVKI